MNDDNITLFGVYKSLKQRIKYICKHDYTFLRFRNLQWDDISNEVLEYSKYNTRVYYPCEQIKLLGLDIGYEIGIRVYYSYFSIKYNDNDIKLNRMYDNNIIDRFGNFIRS